MAIECRADYLIQRIRKMLLSNSTISSIFGSRIRAGHISTLSNIVYPVITITMEPMSLSTSMVEVEEFNIYIDIWIDINSKKRIKDMFYYLSIIQSIFHKTEMNVPTDTYKILSNLNTPSPSGIIVSEDKIYSLQAKFYMVITS